jgi:hypothetical protein
MDNQGQPEPDGNPSAENVEISDGKIIISDMNASDDLNSVEPNSSIKKKGSFLVIKSILVGLFKKPKKSQEAKDDLPSSIEYPNLSVETKSQEDLVHERLGNLLDEEQEVKIIPQLPEELPEEEIQHDLILTGLSTDILPEPPQQQEPVVTTEKQFSPIEDYFQSKHVLAPFLPQDFEDVENLEEETVNGEEDKNNEKIVATHPDSQNSDFNEDPDLLERFQTFLSSEDGTDPFQPPFINDDIDGIDALFTEVDTNSDPYLETPEAIDVSQPELSENWNKAFTADPIPLMNEPILTDIKEEEEKAERDEMPSGVQEGLVHTKNLEEEKDGNLLAPLDDSKTIEDLPNGKENYLDIINEGLVESSNSSEEGFLHNPWETEPDWSLVANRGGIPPLSVTSEEISTEINQDEPAITSRKKGVIASIPVFLRVLIVVLVIIDLAIIGVAGKGFIKAITPLKPTLTLVVPTEITYVYPNALKLPGGWIIQLSRGHLINNKWSPLTAEWLIDTSLRRVVAIPWSQQLEAVTLTLKQGDPIELFMINNDVIIYQVEKVTKVQQNDTSFLKRNTPALILILYRNDSEERWLIICGQQ